MSDFQLIENKKYPLLNSFSQKAASATANVKNTSFIMQQLHEKKIDEFFLVDTSAPPRKHSAIAMIGSVFGTLIPTVLLAKKQQKGLKLSSFKDLSNYINVNYGLKELLLTGLGGVLGGLTGGLIDKNEKKKIQKLEEASYQVMNIAFPAIFVSGAIKMCEKIKGFNNITSKLGFSALGLFAGANLAVTFANKLDDKYFDKYNKDSDRKFKKKDLIVHIDDLFGALILAKIPLAEKLHINKFLPAIFSWSGYSVGDK